MTKPSTPRPAAPAPPRPRLRQRARHVGTRIELRCDCDGTPGLRVGFMLTHTAGEEVDYEGEYTSFEASSFPITDEVPPLSDTDIGDLDYFQGGLMLIVAATNRSLAFIDDTAAGLWVVLDPDLVDSADPAQLFPAVGVDLVGFVLNPSVDFGGSLHPAAASPLRLGLVSVLEFPGGVDSNSPLDQPYNGGDFAYTVADEPHASRLSDIGPSFSSSQCRAGPVRETSLLG